jgi:regulator of cell morphogenesis and NO signaling
MTIDPHLTLNQLIRQYPTVLPAFAAAGIDTCCGGALSLQEAARRAGADLVELVARLETETAGHAGAAVDGSRRVCSCGCVEP